MQAAGAKRKAIALILLAAIAGLAWGTMDVGRTRWLVMVLLGGFALRVLLTARSSRYDKEGAPE